MNQNELHFQLLQDLEMSSLLNIHIGLSFPPGISEEDAVLVKGDYSYCYYGMDGIDDRVSEYWLNDL